MLEINPLLAKRLSFKVSIEGVKRVGMVVRFVIEYNGIEFGFIGKLENGNLKFEIPKLNDIIKGITSTTRQTVLAKIEIISDKSIFQPWKEIIAIIVPQVVEATLENLQSEDVEDSPKINIEIKEKEYKEKPTKKKEKPKGKSGLFSSKVSEFINKMGGENW